MYNKYSKKTANVDNKQQEKKNLTSNRGFILMDNELIVWEKWIQIRKEDTIKLGKRLNKPPVDLIMNIGQKRREKLESKTALEHAQIDKKPKVRGTLFERPPRLKQRCYCEPVYEIHQTPAEIGYPSIIEHISVPIKIQQEELGMSGEPHYKGYPLLNEGYENYKFKREKELEKKILNIDPFRPAASKLMIQGFKPKIPQPKRPPIPSIVIDTCTAVSHNSQPQLLCDFYAVRINNTVLYKEAPDQNMVYLPTFQNRSWYEKCTSWSYYFNVPIKKVGRGKLFLQNLGTVTLRYCWKRIRRPLPYIPVGLLDPVFFFNKNEDVLSPGQSTDVCFTFISDKPGQYSELWELTFANVFFFDTMNERLTVELNADSVEDAEGVRNKIENLKIDINKRTLWNLANEFMNEILDLIFAPVPQTYPYKKYFLEAELFVMKNPVCFYHQTEVAAMHKFYQEMVPGQTWDLSIKSWRSVMKSKDYDNRTKYFNELKKSHSSCLKPWYDGNDLITAKYRAVNDLWRQLANKLDSEYERLENRYGPKTGPERSLPDGLAEDIDPVTSQMIHNIFYLHAYDHVVVFIEQCAGVLSSLDLNRWIEFNFCRY